MPKTLNEIIVAAMQDKKAQHIVSLDLSRLDGSICDTFIICHADSTTQVGAIADGIEEATIRELGEKPRRIQGMENCLWVAVDYVDTMVHIFQTEMRDYYRLEELWGDAPRTEYDSE